jgi:hypothetical protein
VNFLGVYQRENFFLNKNFDFKYKVFEYLYKPYFFVLNAGLSLFKSSNFIGNFVGIPLSILDSLVVPFQKYSKNSKFLLLQKSP